MTANVSIIVAQRENALTIPNGALRFRPPDSAVVETNSAVTPPATNSVGSAGASGAQGHRSTHTRGERPAFHTIYVLSGRAKLQAVQIKTGISDGISTEVLSGLNEGAQVVTGMVLAGTQAAKPASPIGGTGGFPRMR